MRLPVTFEAVEFGALADAREAHLDGLPEAQEMAVEVLTRAAQAFLIRGPDRDACGHALVHPEAGVIEFHLARPYWVFGEQVLRELLQHCGARRARVKTFDALFLTSALPLQCEVKTLGLLCRDHVPRPALPSLGEGFSGRAAVEADWDALWAVDQPVFRHPERLRAVLCGGRVRIFERDGVALGFGIINPVREGHPAVELGIALDASVRGQGLSAALLSDMIEDCKRRGLQPIAGCAVDNHASRAMGERAGFVARYQLLELIFDA